MNPKPWYVYIALLEDGRFYVGMTQVHPEERAHRHQTGWGGTFTASNRRVCPKTRESDQAMEPCQEAGAHRW